MTYRVGQIVEGRVTGIQPYGAFVSLDANTNGLIHISEVSDGYVRDINNFVHVDDQISVKIIDFDSNTNQARLSLKALQRGRTRRRKPMTKKASLPDGDIGFSSISAHLKSWINEAMEEIKHDEI